MKIKKAAHRSAIIILILSLSLLFGYVYQSIGHRIDIKNHPREYSDIVSKYSLEYGVPEYIIYAVILTESGFVSNKVSEDGEIGLMQLSSDSFKLLLSLTKEELDPGILYDPETNIKLGTYMLSHLYTRYNRWKTVLTIYDAGEKTVLEWLESVDNIDQNGNLVNIPDESTKKYVEEVEKNIDMYHDLYYNDKSKK